MRYEPLSSQFYKRNRENFMAMMKGNSAAVFNSNDIYPVSADTELPFEQHRDIFYLSGIDQEETILILFPNAKDKLWREILFIRKSDEHTKIWEGEKLSRAQAKKISGIKNIIWVDDFKDIFHKITTECNRFYFNKNEHYRAKIVVETREDRFIKWVEKEYPSHPISRSNPILQRLRSIKDNEEIDRIQHACNITMKGFERVLKYIKPGVWEFEIEAELIHEFINNSSKGFAYSPILSLIHI